MDREKDIDQLADEYLDLWINHLSKLQLTPWHLMADMSADLDPATIDLYRKWEAFYHSAYHPDSIGEVNPLLSVLQKDMGHSERAGTGGKQSQEKSNSATNAHDVGVDDVAELKARLGVLARRIAELEASSGNTGDDEGQDSDRSIR